MTRLWLPVVLWCGLIFYLSSLTSPPPSGVPFFDIVVPYLAHLGIYFVLMIFLYRASGSLLASFSFGLLYAISDEYHQSFVPSRTPSWQDLLVDCLALGLGAAVISQLLPRAPKLIRTWVARLEL